MIPILRLSLLLFASTLICAPVFPAVQESPDKLPAAEKEVLIELGRGLGEGNGEGVIEVMRGEAVATPVQELPGKAPAGDEVVIELENGEAAVVEELAVVEPELEEPLVEAEVVEEVVIEEVVEEEIAAAEPVIEEPAEVVVEVEEVADSESVVEEIAEVEAGIEEITESAPEPGDGESVDKMLAEARLLLELGNEEEARKIFRDVLTRDPGNEVARGYLEGTPAELELAPVAVENLGQDVIVEAAEEVEAIEAAEVREEDVPRSSRKRVHYFYHRGLDAFKAGNYPEAIHAFEEVQKIDASYRRADHYRREAWERIAEDQWAREYMDELTLRRTMDEMSYDAYGRGREFMRFGRYEAAIDEFQKVLDVDPEHKAAQELMEEARLNLEKKSFEEEVAAAELLVADELEIRARAAEEERMAVREDYHEGERLFRAGEYETSRRKFAEIEQQRGSHRRSSFYLRKIDRELWEEKEAERVDFEAEAIRKYTLGPEDRVRVVVRNHPEFDFIADIEENGELIIPLTNEIIQADGLTRDEMAENIRQYLTAYIDNPFVNVFIEGYGSKKYYVLQPKGGGSEFVMDKASMTLWDVMFRAGIPMLDQAAMRRIQVITPHKTHPTHRWVNVYAMLYQGKMEDNIRIEPGTIIYYPMLAIDKFEMTMKAITRPLKAIVDFQSDWDEFDDWRKEHLK